MNNKSGVRKGRGGWAANLALCLAMAVSSSAGLLSPVSAEAQSGDTAKEQGEIQVLAHPSVNVAYLTRQFLRSAFTLRVRVWPDGEPIRIFVFDDTNLVHTSFCREVLGTYPYVLRRTWDRATFTGTGLVPVRVSSVEEMRRLVRETPGAIGYLPTQSSGISQSRVWLNLESQA